MVCYIRKLSVHSVVAEFRHAKTLRNVVVAGFSTLIVVMFLQRAFVQNGEREAIMYNSAISSEGEKGPSASPSTHEKTSLQQQPKAQTKYPDRAKTDTDKFTDSVEARDFLRGRTSFECNIPRGSGVMPYYPASTGCRIRNLVLKNGRFYFVKSSPPLEGHQLRFLKRELVDLSPTPLSESDRCTDVITSPTIIHHCVLNFQNMYHVFLEENMSLYFTSRVDFGAFPEDLQIVFMKSHFGAVTPCTYEFATGGGILSVAYPLVTLLSSRQPIWREHTDGKTICFKHVVTGIERAFDPQRVSYAYRGGKPPLLPRIPGAALTQYDMVNEVVSRLLKNAGVRKTKKKGPQIIYQHRRDISSPHEWRSLLRRRVVEKAELALIKNAIKEECAKFRDCTFVFLDAFEHTVPEQLQIAASSDIIIGPMGAGMTELLFLRQPSATIVLDDPAANGGAPDKDIIPLLAFMGRHGELLETGHNKDGRMVLLKPNGMKDLRSAIRRALFHVGGVCRRETATCKYGDGG